MTTRLQLPDGEWADLRDADELTNRQRGTLRRSTPAVARLQEKLKLARLNLGLPSEDKDLSPEANAQVLATLDDDDMEAYFDMQARSIVAHLAAWSLKNPDGTARPLPDSDSVNDVEGKWFDPLAEACLRVGGADPVDFEPDPVADSPTVPSQP